jgi:hypothetical protein
MPPALRELAKLVRGTLQQVVLRQVLRKIRRSPRVVLSDVLFELLAWGWGNRAYIAEVEYLRGIVDGARTATGSILECGSGLSTLVTGALIEGTKTTLYALEHDSDWYARTCAMVEKFSLRNVRPVYAPLKDFGGFCWYEIREADLPRDISLVLCDGPPGYTKGGRYGLLPVCKPIFAGALILVDDYKRAENKSSLSDGSESLAGC